MQHPAMTAVTNRPMTVTNAVSTAGVSSGGHTSGHGFPAQYGHGVPAPRRSGTDRPDTGGDTNGGPDTAVATYLIERQDLTAVTDGAGSWATIAQGEVELSAPTAAAVEAFIDGVAERVRRSGSASWLRISASLRRPGSPGAPASYAYTVVEPAAEHREHPAYAAD